ncbi:hypothetical protein GCM10027039_08470 [Terrabacter koreensis]
MLRASGSFDAGPNIRPRTTIQKPTTSHFVTRVDGILAKRPISPVLFSCMVIAPLPEWSRAQRPASTLGPGGARAQGFGEEPGSASGVAPG